MRSRVSAAALETADIRLCTRKLKRVGILTRKVSWCNVEIMINNNECMINNKKQVILRAIFLGWSIVMKKC